MLSGSASRDLLLYYYICLSNDSFRIIGERQKSITLLIPFFFYPGLVKLVYRMGGLEPSTEHERRTKLGQELCWFADYSWRWEWIILQTGKVKTPIFVPKKEQFVHSLSRLVQRLDKRSQHTKGTVKRATKTCNLLCNKTSWKPMLRVLLTTNQACLAKIKLLQNVESRSTHCGAFYRPKANLFCRFPVDKFYSPRNFIQSDSVFTQLVTTRFVARQV